MVRPATKIRLDGLSRLDVLELQQLARDAVQVEAREASDEHGEPLTTAVIILSAAALNVLAAWLLKNRKGKSFRRTVEVIDAYGSARREMVEYHDSSSEAPKASILKQLSSITHVDVSQILAGTGGSEGDDAQ